MNKGAFVCLIAIVGILGLAEVSFGLGLKPNHSESQLVIPLKNFEVVSTFPHRVGASLLSPSNRNAQLQKVQQTDPCAAPLRPYWASTGDGGNANLGWENSIEAGASVNGTYIGRWGVPIIITVTVGVTIYLIFIARGR